MTSQDESVSSARSSGRARVESVDVFRGLTILLMVFVNDLGPAAPAWMHHIQPPDADGMTLADVVFPFFLFLVGVSIPLAVERSRAVGLSTWAILRHIISRTLALLIMGLVGVNLWGQQAMDPRLWGLLAYLSILLAWSVVPQEPGRKRTLAVCAKWIGAAGLIALLAVYRREPVSTQILGWGTVSDWSWLRTQWWGILGLIGWAYLVASLVYLLVGPRREWIVACAGLLMTSFVAQAPSGFFSRIDQKPWLAAIAAPLRSLESILQQIDRYVSFSTQLGSLAALVTLGMLLGTVLLPDSSIRQPQQRVRWAATFLVLLFFAGTATDTFGGVNKIAATPTWCFWCASLATAVWIPLYLLIDVAGRRQWATPIRIAGMNPLIAYLLHPIVLFLLGLLGWSTQLRGYAQSPDAWIVIAGSAAMSACICLLTTALAHCHFRVRI